MFKFSRLKKSIPSPHILYNYLNQPVKRLREALGLVDSNELTPGATSTIPSQVKKIEDKSFSIGGQAYDTYSLKAWTVVSGDYVYAVDMGVINVSEGLMLITKDSTNLSADDTAGSGGWVNGPLTSGDGVSAGSGSTFVEDDGTSEVILCNGPMYINQDNGISGTDDNYMFIILAALAALPVTFDAEIYVDVEFVVEAGAKVKHIKF